MQTAGDGEPSPFNRVGDAGCIGLGRALVAQGLPSLRLAASRLIELAHPALLAAAPYRHNSSGSPTVYALVRQSAVLR
jgi:hypothetical protein